MVLIAIVVAVLVWLLFLRGEDDSGSQSAAGEQGSAESGQDEPAKTVEVVSAEDLPDTVADVRYRVYWVGPRTGIRYEVTVLTQGETYVRYLPEGEKPRSETPLLTVGSYRRADAFTELERLATKNEGELFDVPGGGRGLVRADTPTGVYVAFPGENTQIEVFDPEPGQALELAKAGVVVPVE